MFLVWNPHTMIVAWLMARKLPFWHRNELANPIEMDACCWVRDLMTTTEQAGPLGGKLIRRTNCGGRRSNVEKINSRGQMANGLVIANYFEGGNYVHRHRMISFGEWNFIANRYEIIIMPFEIDETCCTYIWTKGVNVKDFIFMAFHAAATQLSKFHLLA